MCELFAMSSRLPADVHFSLEAFSRHGGLEGPHKDGWGIAYYVEEDVRLVKEPRPASDSACVRFIQENPFASSIVVSHIRKATQGAVTLKNCQPFVRELGGRMHVFAHNGNLDRTALETRLPAKNFHPVGDTDSERAFCGLLELLRPTWLAGEPADLPRRSAVVARFAALVGALGPANFIYSDGQALFVHGHKRTHPGSASPRAPGLHVLCRHCAGRHGDLATAGLRVAAPAGQDAEQTVVLAASVPLTAEPGWRPLAEGELVVAVRGAIVAPAPASA